MIQKQLFLLLAAACCISVLSAGSTASQSANTNSQTLTIDQQIEQCKKELEMTKMQKYMAESDADRFLSQNWEDYQRAITRQELCQRKIEKLTAKLAELEKQKTASK